MVSVCDYNISCSIPGSALNKGSPVGLGYYGSICRFEPTGGRGSSCARIARHCERRRSWSFKNLSDFFGCFAIYFLIWPIWRAQFPLEIWLTEGWNAYLQD